MQTTRIRKYGLFFAVLLLSTLCIGFAPTLLNLATQVTGTLANSHLAGSGVTTISGVSCTVGSTCTMTSINGTSIPVNSAADQIIITTASAVGAWKSLPSCSNDGAHALVYDTSTHAISCIAIAGASSCPTCLLGPDTSIIGGIVGANPNGNNSSTVTPFTSLVNASNAGLIMPFSAGFRNLSVYYSVSQNGAIATFDFQREGVGVQNRNGMAGVNVFSGAAAGTYRSSYGEAWRTLKGDVVDINFGAIATNAGSRGIAWEIVGTTSQLLGTFLNGNTVAASTTSYTGPSQGTSTSLTTEGIQGVVVPYAATAQNLCIRTNSTQSVNNSFVVTLRKNGTTSTALTLTIALGQVTGVFCDTTHTVALAAGDWITWELKNNATGTTGTLLSLTMELASPTAPATAMIVFGTGNQTITSGAARYFTAYALSSSQANEVNARGPMPRAGTMKNLACLYTTPPGTNSVVATVYKNGSASALTVTIPTTGSGVQIQTDSTHTVSFSQGDNFSIEFNQSSGSNPAISSCSVEID